MYSLDTNPLSAFDIENIFYKSVFHLLILFTGSFTEQKSLI